MPDPQALARLKSTRTDIALLLNRLVLASTAKGAQTQHDIPVEDRITDADIDSIESRILAKVDKLALVASETAQEPEKEKTKS